MINYKILISIITIILMFVAYIPYIKDTLNNKTVPHTFTWLIWVFTVGITFALQVKGGAGVGSLVTLVLLIVCFFIFILGLYKKNKDITWLDIVFLIFSLISLFIWLVIKKPVLSIIIIVIVDVLAFVPTIRKSWNNPHSETLSLFQIVTIRHALSIFALQQYNILTWLSPVASTFANLIFVIILIIRRKKLSNTHRKMKKNIKAIIFDWDGVIVDSMGWISEAMQEVLLSYGVKKSSEEVRNEFFQPGSDFYNSHGVEIKDRDELKRRHKKAIAKHKIFDPLFPEVKEVLRFLKKNNFKLGIVSSTDNSELERQLELLDIKEIFTNEFILGKASNKKEKLHDLIKIFNLPLDEILYIGDISTDIISAKAVGVKSAGIERREEARKKLGAQNPDYLFSSLRDLKILLEKQ